MSTSERDKIAARQKRIAEEMAALQREAEELAVAKRVIDGLSGPPKKQVTITLTEDFAPRPKGIPTTYEMMQLLLEKAEKDGKDGLTGKELVEGIRTKYWPGVKSGQVLPTIYSFIPNRVHKAGGKFKRLKKP